MLSGVLHSDRAVYVNIAIMRAFVMLREALSLHKELAQRLAELERMMQRHEISIQSVFDAMRAFTDPPKEPPRRIGFLR